MEKTYINLLRGRPAISELEKFSKISEKRVRFRASREIKTFFYLETPEGYYASEHEIVMMHILLSWGYSLKKQFNKAYVEAKVASNLLSNHWSEEGRFDDAFLRIFLAYVWALSGNWQEARVDFRVAYNLQPRLTWLKKLSNLQEQPKELLLVLGGVGPEPFWKPGILSINPLRKLRNLDFTFSGKKSPAFIIDRQRIRTGLYISPSSKSWYKRHVTRDNEIHDLIKDSTYGQLIFLNLAKATTVSVLGFIGGVTVMTLGVATGAGLIYIGAEFATGDAAVGLVIAGFGVMIAGFKAGAEIISDSFSSSVKETKRNLDVAERYRFVRFLPDYAWVGWKTNEKFSYPIYMYAKNRRVLRIGNRSKRKVKIIFYPDTR
ncbi:MAG: hypothetical protein AAF518_23740 [Spirochaetota bacterium]